MTMKKTISMMLLIFSLLALSAISAFASNVDSEATDRAMSLTTIENGRLSFSNMDAFEQFMGQVVTMDEATLNQLEDDLGFVSLRSAHQKAAESSSKNTNTKGDTTPEELYVDDMFFATALNQLGEILIGTDIYKVGENYVHRVNVKDAEHLKSITAQSGSLKSTKVTSTKILKGKNSKCSYFNSEHRVCGFSEFRNWWIYKSGRAKTFSQEYRKFLFWSSWRAEDISSVSLSGTSTKWGSIQATKTNDDSVSRTYFWQVCVGSVSSCHANGKLTTKHTGKRGNSTRTFTTTITQ